MSKQQATQAQPQMTLDPTEGIYFDFGYGAHGHLFGGPYRKFQPTRRLAGVKMAAEIDRAHDVSIPTQDFSVPAVKDMRYGLRAAVQAMKNGNDLYVGCMGGIGRTGLFIGCMIRLSYDWDVYRGVEPSFAKDAVAVARRLYMAHTIETAEQVNYVMNFDTGPVIKSLVEDLINPLTVEREVIREVKVEVPVEVFKEVYLTPWDWAQRLFFGPKS